MVNIFITNPENVDVATNSATKCGNTLSAVLITGSNYTTHSTQEKVSATFEVSGCFNGGSSVSLAESGLESAFSNAGELIEYGKYTVSVPNNPATNIGDGGLNRIATAFDQKSNTYLNIWIIEPNERIRLLSRTKNINK